MRKDTTPSQTIYSESEPPIAGTWTARWGLLLRMARQVAGLSLTELAARSGLSKGYLSKLESAHPSAANPSRATLVALARALPSTWPLIQRLDPDDGLPTATFLLEDRLAPMRGHSLKHPLEAAGQSEERGVSRSSTQDGPLLSASWEKLELLLAILILERSGGGPPTLALLQRACGDERATPDTLLLLERDGLIRRLPPDAVGGGPRYTLNIAKLQKHGIQRPADIFIHAAISFLLEREHHAEQRSARTTKSTPAADQTVR